MTNVQYLTSLDNLENETIQKKKYGAIRNRLSKSVATFAVEANPS